MIRERTGRCLCGDCTYHFKAQTVEVGACHCGMCRKWSGGVFMALHAPDGKVDIDEGSPIQWYESSDWGKRGFCGHCGTNLFWAMRDGSMLVPTMGSLDNIEDLNFTSEIYIDHKPQLYEFANKTHQQTEEEFTAQFKSL